MRALIVALVAASPALADEGEVYLGADVGVEAVALRHPVAQGAEWTPLGLPNALLARAGVVARLGVTNELHPGVGLEFAAANNVMNTDVVLGGAPARVVTGTYLEIGAPLGVGWRIDTGYDVSGVLGVDLVPHVAWWAMNAATEPARPGDVGPSRVLPIEVADAVRFGGSVRLRAAVELRVLEVLAIQLVPHVGVSSDGAPTWRAGIALQATWALGVGSSWRK